MEEILTKIIKALPVLLQGLGGLVVFATAIAKLSPKKEDDQKIELIGSKFYRFISYLPTIGINPRTDQIEHAYKKLQEEQIKAVMDNLKND